MLTQNALELVIAALLGAAIGVQRQFTQKPAGIRTHALVALGSCAFAMYSALLHDTRIAAGVITGIGFLGAGAIVRHGFSTRGLTTAASIWTAAAVGMGVGLGGTAWVPVVVVLSVLTLLLLAVSDNAVLRLMPRRTNIAIVVDADLTRISLVALQAGLERCVERARFREELTIGRIGEGRRVSIGYVIELDVHRDLPRVFDDISALDGVLRVSTNDEAVVPTS
jgi:putative Mg2+ transporter-C (MgtC) family protein